jgi:carbonic anhydrase
MVKPYLAVPFFLLAFALFLAAQQPVTCPPGTPCPVCDPPIAGDPLTALRMGNERFVKADPKHLHQSVSCGAKLACCQKPFAVILSCSDSRVPPEVAFDQGIGDLFVVREAGNVAPPGVLGSIEYAVEHLDVKFVVVLGHRRCGAVEAAFCPKPPPHIDTLWTLIRPAIPPNQYLPSCEHHPAINPAWWDQAVRKNIDNMTEIVRKDLAHRTDVRVVAAYYDMDTSKIEFPKQ